MGSDPSTPSSAAIPTPTPDPFVTALAATLAAAPDAALAHDGAGAIVAANERACALLGYRLDALLARPLAELAPGADAALARLAPGESCSVEREFRRADGARLSADVHLARLALAGAPLYVCHLRDTAARRESAAALQRRDEQLRVFLDSNPAACFQKDREGRYQLANASCAAILGMDPADCIGKTDFELFPREAAEAIRARDRKVIGSGEVSSARITVPSAHGPRRVLLHKFPVRDAEGRVAGVAGIASDVTEHEAATEQLRLRDQQLAIFVDNSPAACFQKDLDGRYELMNATCAALYGREPAACIGKTDRELNPDGAAVFEASDRAALARGDVYACEEVVPSADGIRHFITHKFPIRDAHGRTVSLAGTAVEVTEIKRADILAREAEARLRAIVQAMPVMLDAFDDQGRIVAWNSECERVTGYTADEIVGNPRALELLYPEPGYVAAMLAEANELRDQQYSRVFELTAKDGTPKIIEWFNVGARLKIDGWREWSVGIEITERRRLEAALHEAAVLEQRRLGHDLHDGLGQELTGLSLLASAWRAGTPATVPSSPPSSPRSPRSRPTRSAPARASRAASRRSTSRPAASPTRSGA